MSPDAELAVQTARAAKVPRYAIISAAIIVLVFLGLTLVMMFSVSSYADNDVHWTHSLLIYNSFMSFATAAAGVLLGTQIQQSSVAASQKQATEAKVGEKTAKDAIHNALSLMQGDVTESGGTSELQSGRYSSARQVLMQALR